MTERDLNALGEAAASALFRLAVAYNDALDRCTQSGGENIDEVMAFFADDAVRIATGVGEAAGVVRQVGREAIRESFLQRVARLQQRVELSGIELCGDFVICRRERRDTTYAAGTADHGLRILLVKGGKIQQLVVVTDWEERVRLQG